MLKKEDYIAFGSSRIVFHYKDGAVIKYPLFSMGIDANIEEYNNFLQNPESVANSYLLDNGLLLQEELIDCFEFSRREVNSGQIQQLLIDKYGKEGIKFLNHIMDKKLCIGINLQGIPKQYDCENLKNKKLKEYMRREPHLLFTEDMVDDFINFINEIGDENVNKIFYKESKIC